MSLKISEEILPYSHMRRKSYDDKTAAFFIANNLKAIGVLIFLLRRNRFHLINKSHYVEHSVFLKTPRISNVLF